MLNWGPLREAGGDYTSVYFLTSRLLEHPFQDIHKLLAQHGAAEPLTKWTNPWVVLNPEQNSEIVVRTFSALHGEAPGWVCLLVIRFFPPRNGHWKTTPKKQKNKWIIWFSFWNTKLKLKYKAFLFFIVNRGWAKNVLIFRKKESVRNEKRACFFICWD